MLKIIGRKILVTKDKPKEETKSGIILSESAQEISSSGEIVSWGGDVKVKLKAGSRAHFNKYTGSDFKYEDREYLLIDESDILAIEE